ncbi:hypothetical protein [Bacillus sp. FJAT-28004]|uniref:hypothetical protein n=1 Tax=Bacillus sp. FJAT-28004 TaxID=1679165 RepID=UPI0006B49ACE|nr:hypothetical protein [Bacillus sp. FJAT-28004]
MADNKEIKSEELAKVAASLSAVGYGLVLLALERADQESLESKGKERNKMSAAINKLHRRFNR